MWKDDALLALEEAVQALGQWSEVTTSRSARHALIELIEKIDEVGEEVKALDETLP